MDNEIRSIVRRIQRQYIPKKRIKARRNNEDQAVETIRKNLGNLTKDNVRKIAELLDTDLWKSRIIRRRFGLLLWGRNLKLMLANNRKKLNLLFSEVFDKENLDDIEDLISDLKGVSDGFVSCLLYLKDRKKYNVFVNATSEGVRAAFPKEPDYSGSFRDRYVHFNRLANEFRREYGLEPQEMDIILTDLPILIGQAELEKVVQEAPTRATTDAQTLSRNWWVEKTIVKGRPDRETGDYSLGKVLWSPQSKRGGGDIYKSMREIKKGDVVLHFIDNATIVGISIVDTGCDPTFFCLPGTAWDDGTGKRPGYLVTLEDYRKFEKPIDRSDILNEKNKDKLLSLLKNGYYLFYNKDLELNQGAYLTEAPLPLAEIINEVYKGKNGQDLPFWPKLPQISLSREAEKFIEKFKTNPENQARLERKIKAFEKWRAAFSVENIDKLSQEEFRSFLSFKENQSWDGIQRQPSIYEDMDKLRRTIKFLVNGINDLTIEEIQKRFDSVIEPNGAFKIKGLGRAVVTGIIHVSDTKNRLGVWNKKVDVAFAKLGLLTSRPTRSKGEQYLAYNNILNILGKQYDLNLYQVDMLMHEIAINFVPTHPRARARESVPGKRFPSIDEVISYIKSKGFFYPEETIKNYHTSLETKPFVILSGITGIGKTKLTELYANGFHDIDQENEYYKIIPVQPNWNDKKPLLGYYNPIMETYYKTPFLDFLLKASEDCQSCDLSVDGKCTDKSKCTRKYFVCLDEMNLAHVEYYFADFLSAMESDRIIDLHSTEVKTEDGKELDPQIRIPENLHIVGTVNIDETTKEFSPKVLDRANTIYLDVVDLDKWLEIQESRGGSVDHDAFKVVKEIHELLKKHGMHFGYRVCNEILDYVQNSILTKERALDLQIMQKILPKLSGDDNVRLRGSLQDLKDYLENKPYTSSKNKVKKMLDKLEQQGFTSFFD